MTAPEMPETPGWWEDHPHVGREIEVVWPAEFVDLTIPVGTRLRVISVAPGLAGGRGYFFEHEVYGWRCISEKRHAGAGKQGWVKQIRLVPVLEELARCVS